MAFDAWFIHTCTIERNQSNEDDDYRARTQRYLPVARDVACRLKITSVRNPLPDVGEGPMIPRYQCYLAAGNDVQNGDQVTDVLDEDDSPIEGVFRVKQVLPRRSRIVRHITLELEKVR